MKDNLREVAEFGGRACGTVARDLTEFSQSVKPVATELAAAFRRGWHEAMSEPQASRPAAPTSAATEPS